MKKGENFCLLDSFSTLDLPALAQKIMPLVFRYDFSMPGFCMIRLGKLGSPEQLKSLMVSLKQHLEELYLQKTEKYLCYLSIERSSRKYTTKYHLEATPCNESLLILGYEPTTVASNLYIRDYSRYIFDRQYKSQDFFSECKDFLVKNCSEYSDYTTLVFSSDDADSYRIVIVNNSFYPDDLQQQQMLGVMHKAEVPTAEKDDVRIINTLALGVMPQPSCEYYPEDIQNFIQNHSYNII